MGCSNARNELIAKKLTFLFTAWCLLVTSAFATGPVKIVTIGDSITQADQSRQSYRYRLWTKLLDANLDFDFVGSMDGNAFCSPACDDTANVVPTSGWPDYQGESFDRDHEGHWGWSADDVLFGRDPGDPNLSEWLAGYTPDLVLMHLGTNDVLEDRPIPDILNSLKAVIDTIRSDNPNVTSSCCGTINALTGEVFC